MASARVPVLTYHPAVISGNAYAENNPVAFAADLLHLDRLGFRICPLSNVVDALEEGQLHHLGKCVAITFDDGTDFDVQDLQHPAWGMQRGVLGILAGARLSALQTTVEATTFPIVSPRARTEMDRAFLGGKGWWNDDWWPAAESSGLLRVENHSWDHNHEGLSSTVADAPRGAFELTTWTEADAEIRVATEYLCRKRGRDGPVLFAYPYGPASDYLATEYFPNHRHEHGVRAAFTTDGVPISAGADPWRLPRYVFGWHWKSPEDLERLLRECVA